VTLEEEVEEVRSDAAEFGWTFREYEAEDRAKLVYMNPFNSGGGFVDRIQRSIDKVDGERVVIDSTSVMGMYDDNPGKIRERLYDLTRSLRREDVTAVLTSEIPRGDDDTISRFGVEEFVADGVIVMHYMGIGAGIYRNLEIPKIRKTNQEKGSFPFKISDDGITVYEDEEAYADAQADD